MVFVIGCNDSAIPEVEFQVPDEDQQLELTPPSANPEPPELIAAYNDLWMEIEAEQRETGKLDSAKVLEANLLAIERAKYDGTMAETFATLEIILDAHAEGKTVGEIQEELSRMRAKNPLSTAGGVGPCRQCYEDHHEETEYADNEFAIASTACTAGGIKYITRKPSGAGVIKGLLGYTGCLGVAIWRHDVLLLRANTKFERCKEEKCKGPE